MSHTPGARAPSMLDVARAAGVSAQTVSRVLRDHPYVAPEKQARVLRAVEALGYRRNPAAQALSSGRTSVIGLVSMTGDSYAGAITQSSIEYAADARGYVVVGAHATRATPEAIHDALERVTRLGAEAIILAHPVDHLAARTQRLIAGLPTVSLSGAASIGGASLAIDQAEVARLATSHLLALGHRSVWHLSGPGDWADSVAREHAWRTTLQAADAAIPPVLHGDWSPAGGYAAGLTLPADATAVFASNDEMAFGLIHALRETGRRVPEDVSVVGVDDVPLAAYSAPPLTTVAQPFAPLGAAAVAALTARLEGGRDPDPQTFVPQLVVRKSTAQPRSH
ncbi:DNA-binding LacI/PurR family transcriptional regulator [Leucobacter exalbidus]|uniref:DNA-binding LacI/PurR family transcriptional regulator n=1 Tax=Leucobacter exalbidus TaxID=662960 RepID=A0A940T505_9MICO|nr:LacI family DNA-binding transcriptional regulator [Leucobacter exalbidus]MBP1327513.1 DNA-binding LacI/PurR family transcriptional regulator [Leucobacter exalbidus]